MKGIAYDPLHFNQYNGQHEITEEKPYNTSEFFSTEGNGNKSLPVCLLPKFKGGANEEVWSLKWLQELITKRTERLQAFATKKLLDSEKTEH